MSKGVFAFLRANLAKVKIQRSGNQQQFAAIWLNGAGGSFSRYIPADPNSNDNPQINSANAFSPPTMDGQNYIVSTVEDRDGKKIHAEQVIYEQVWHNKI